jgi:DNA (cytosine-5)-methyltransferase 1
MMKHGSLFSGIGGFDLASERMGWKNIFHCEWNPFGQKVLKHYWPSAISYDDITKTDFTIHRGQIDILTGGFPCQPYSTAGKRLGKEDERHLWPEMLRAIREIQPRFIVGENVSGLINWNAGMVFNEVQADLEAEGYSVTPFVLPACAVNAPHRRDRVWFVAYSGVKQLQRRTPFGNCQNTEEERTGLYNRFERSSNFGNAANSKITNKQRYRVCKICTQRKTGRCDCIDNATETDNQRQQECHHAGQPEGQGRVDWSIFSPKNWADFPTQSPVCNGDDGLSSRLDGITFPKWRNESIKAGGNAIVPQVALQIFKAIDQFQHLQS